MNTEIKAKKYVKFISLIGKKNIIIICSILLIGAAVYLNWVFYAADKSEKNDFSSGLTDVDNNLGQSEFVNAGETNSVEEYFAVSSINRQRARDEAMEVLMTIIDNESALQEAKDKAVAGIEQIASEIEAEANIETLIMGKGFKECVAVLNGDKASIIVKSDGLLLNEISQIKEIVYEQATILPVNIKITEKK